MIYAVFLAWFVLKGKENRVKLNFLIPGRTKSVCDEKFGLVERRMRRTDVAVSAYLMDATGCSSEATDCVSSVEADWPDWKSYLEQFGTMPATFKIQRYYIFAFDKSTPGKVKVRRLSSRQPLRHLLS